MGTQPVPERASRRAGVDPLDLDVDTFKKRTAAKTNKKAEDLPRKLFRAGYFSADDRARFNRLRMLAFGVSSIACPALLILIGANPVVDR